MSAVKISHELLKMVIVDAKCFPKPFMLLTNMMYVTNKILSCQILKNKYKSVPDRHCKMRKMLVTKYFGNIINIICETKALLQKMSIN